MEKNLIYGRNPVYEYLNQGSKIAGATLYVSEKAHGKIINQILSKAKAKELAIFYQGKDFFEKIGTSSVHQGVALKLKDIQKPSLEENEFLTQVASRQGTLVLLDQLTDPHNVGSIIRTSEALGVDGVIIPRDNSVSITPAVIKSSAGATAHLKIIKINNVAAFLRKAKEIGFWIVSTSDHGSDDLNNLKKIKPAIIVIGSEGKGIRRLTEVESDYLVKIPLKGKISSLNASVAAGIIIYSLLKD